MNSFQPKPGQTDYTHIRYAPVVNCVLFCEGKILLVKRSKDLKFYPNVWNGISGFLDDGKDFEEKVKEEVSEEVGVAEENIVSIRRGEILHQDEPKYGKTWIVHPVLVEVKTNVITLDWEAREYRWLSIDEAKKLNFLPGFDEVLSRIENLIGEIPGKKSGEGNNVQGMTAIWFGKVVEIAKRATCRRSKCGSIIVKDGNILGEGFNSPPKNDERQRRCECSKDDLDRKVTDKTCCIHAETRAILDALRRYPDKVSGSRLYFVRLDDSDKSVPSGEPYCTLCSKLALDVGIADFVLWHESGLTVYDTAEYNQLSYRFRGDGTSA